MTRFTRYGVYALPDPDAPWAQFCTAWLGWDVTRTETVDHPAVSGLRGPVSALTAVPRRYGLHATMKPPFRIKSGKTRQSLDRALSDLTARLAPVSLDGLELSRLGRFLALTPRGDPSALNALAAACVRDLDGFRAPAPPEELERRRANVLTPAQDANLQKWGYPYVMDQFRFHMTLTGRLPKDDLIATETALSARLSPLLPEPFIIRDLALVGEDEDGFFHLVERFPLRG